MAGFWEKAHLKIELDICLCIALESQLSYEDFVLDSDMWISDRRYFGLDLSL
jgi:hypothetical protein